MPLGRNFGISEVPEDKDGILGQQEDGTLTKWQYILLEAPTHSTFAKYYPSTIITCRYSRPPAHAIPHFYHIFYQIWLKIADFGQKCPEKVSGNFFCLWGCSLTSKVTFKHIQYNI